MTSLRKFILRINLLALVLYLNATAYSQVPDHDSLARNPSLFIKLASKALKWTEPAEPTKIVGPIYFVGTKGLGSYLITTEQGHILMYTGMPGSGPMIEASIRKLGFKTEDIKYILSGHAHADHAGGHAYIKKISGAKVALMEAEKELLESGGKSDFHYAEFPEFWFDPVKVDLILHDRDMIKLGDIIMTALATPGHTKGDNTWITTVVDNGEIYSVVFPDGTSINPGYRFVQDPSYPGIENNYRITLHTLEMLKPDIWLSCHTDFFGFEEKRKRVAAEGLRAWVDPEGYRRRIAGERAKFEAELNAQLGVPEKEK